MEDYNLDRAAFKINTFKEADNSCIFDKDVPYIERLNQGYYLSLMAYGYTLDNQPKLDRTVFAMHKAGN